MDWDGSQRGLDFTKKLQTAGEAVILIFLA
jgi:hypothetical protein